MLLDAATQLNLTPLALKTARERAGLSQEAVAARSGISLPAIQSYECSGHRPQYSYLLMLLEAYGMDLGSFYDLLIEIHAERQRTDMEERIARLEGRIEAYDEAALAAVDTSHE
ncbi:MAG: helix-turn-helix transcriptional regulator [Planctomycetota bacterium]|nr:helix-turn-helix transcriptional regulator [Planctomycetota bacterium]